MTNKCIVHLLVIVQNNNRCTVHRIKIIEAQQTVIYNYKNTRLKLLKTNAAILYNKICKNQTIEAIVHLLVIVQNDTRCTVHVLR